VHEVVQSEELERGLRPSNRQYLSVELKKIHVHVDRIAVDLAAKAERQSQQVVRVADILINLGLLPIEGIPQLLKTTQEALPTVTLILKCLQEALDSSAGPWV
jgi:hypothetical protein